MRGDKTETSCLKHFEKHEKTTFQMNYFVVPEESKVPLLQGLLILKD